MFDHLADQFDILWFDLPGHGASDNVTPFVGWNDAAERAHCAAVATGLFSGRSVYGIGHSLGGVLTLLSAHRHPQTYKSLVLLDPILFPAPMVVAARIVRAMGLTSWFNPQVKATIRRRQHWPDHAAVVEHLRRKSVFRDWTDESLQCFAHYATSASDHGVSLACHPQTETDFFAAMPDGLWRALDRVQCPVTMVMGQSSYPFALRAASAAAKRNTLLTAKFVVGSHCFMLEQPEMAAQQIIAAIEADH